MTGRDAVTPPLPDLDDPVLAGYWAAAARAELVVQRCLECECPQWPPRETCARCGPGELGWQRVAGTGTLFTWTVVHHTTIEAYAVTVPFAVGAVELTDVRVRMLGRILGPTTTLEIDMPVEVAFEPIAAGIALPVWHSLDEDDR